MGLRVDIVHHMVPRKPEALAKTQDPRTQSVDMFKKIKKTPVIQNPTDNRCGSWSHVLAP